MNRDQHKRIPFTLPVRVLHASSDNPVRETLNLELVGAMCLRGRDVHIVINTFAGVTERFALTVTPTDGLRPTEDLRIRADIDSGKNDVRSRIGHGLVELLATPNGQATLTDLILAWGRHCHSHDIPVSDMAQRALALTWAAKHQLPQPLLEALRDQAPGWDGPIDDLGNALLAAANN